MKKVYITLLSVLLFTFHLYSQDSNVTKFKFRVIRGMSLVDDKYGDFQYMKDWADTSFLVQLDTEGKTLSFFTSPITVYDFVTTATKFSDGGSDFIRWTFLDKNAVRGTFKIMLPYPNEKACFLYIIYSNVTYVYIAAIDKIIRL